MKRAFLWGMSALVIWIATVILANVVVQFRVPVSLPIDVGVLHGNGFFTASGTWDIEGNRIYPPLQTTRITCYKNVGYCYAATARVNEGNHLAVDFDPYPVTEWAADHVVFVDETPKCVKYVYMINSSTKSVTGVRIKRDDLRKATAEDCAHVDKELRLTLRSGFDISRQERDRAMPWFGKVALAPFR